MEDCHDQSRKEAELIPDEEKKKEAELIERLVRRVMTEINKTPMGLTPYPVGLHSRVEEVMKLLDIGSKTVQVVGVHGLGGIGKTTLAKALFNRLVGYFERHSFISNVREISAGHDENGLVTLQNILVSDLSNRKMDKINQTTAGIAAIKVVVNEKRVLVVLDDVDSIDQLSALVGNGQWFYEGSRIIVTTRDRELLTNHRVNHKLYEVRELDGSDALELFSHHALGIRDIPADTFLKLSKEIVDLTGGLPLALEVFGSSLYDKRTEKVWIDALHKLRQIRPRDLQDVLMISYNALDDQEKCIFLDIACLFVKMKTKREDAIVILKGCGFDGEIVLTVLTARSLIKITEDTTLWMHDQVRDMGRQIVTQENISHPGMRSRLWDRDEIMNVFKYDKGTPSIQGIVLDFEMKRMVSDIGGDRISWDNFRRSPNCTTALTYLKERYKAHRKSQEERKGEVNISSTAFGAMVNLRLLQMNNVNLEGNSKFLPAGVKWLQWKGCPLRSLPSDFLPPQLAVLDLSDSNITSLWGGCSIMVCFNCLTCSGDGNKVAEKLMFLNLSNCIYLTAIPDLSGNRALQQLNLEHCISLIKLHGSIGNLNTLVHLNLRECSKLVELPSDVSGLKKLEYLILSGCSQFKKLPNMDSLVSLKELLLDDTAIQSLPQSIFRLTKLEKLILNRCSELKELPVEIGKLSSLKEISLNGSGLEKLPNSIGSLANLEKLSLFWCKSLTTLPNSIGKLNFLVEVSTYGTPLTELPVTIGSLSSLKDLSVGHGQFLSSLPDSVGRLRSLVVLKIEQTSITDLPQEIGELKTLEKLELRKCESLRSLPESIGSMRALTSIIITAANITELPESIGRLENLTILQLNTCRQFRKLPASIEHLKSLHRLQMVKTAVTELPETFGMLSSLMVLSMGKKPQNGRHAEEKFILPASFSNLSLLYELDACACNISGEIADDFEKLSSLETLNLGHNSFCRLPASLSGLSTLGKLSLPHCKKLKSLPPLPSSLKEVDIANCTALESISDISNLENLTDFNLTSCEKVMDIPGLECLDSLVRLYMSGCNACTSAVKRRLAKKSYLRKIRNLSMPGSKIPDWFSQEMVTFSKRENRPLKSVILCVVVSLNHQTPDDTREEFPAVVDIQAQILILDSPTFTTTLVLSGVPNTNEDQFHLCRYPTDHPLVSQLKDGYKIHVMRREPPHRKGVELKKWGLYLIYEGDDDYEGDEESLNESQQSLSEQLANFFSSFE
ncbi:disease resistance protein RPV1 isoform X2 [Rosa chinensis]|uniref:disease resistance protein RPV1 isoform X2 n=1 Tax=Rosa chinensis TaxID=74649 RepID=UPI000D097AE9|nr:disease resistance protein RPV1 isoform X2 [Rosa chinensis]